jgi:hypothetical protein
MVGAMPAREHVDPDRATEAPEREVTAEPAGPANLPRAMTTFALAAGSARTAAFARRAAAPPTIARQPVLAPAGPLTDAQATEAVEWTNARYDELSIRIIQHLAGAPVTGTFDEATAQAVATLQRAHGLLVDGKVGNQTLTNRFPDRIAASAHDQLIHLVADLNDIDITTDTIAVRFDSTLAKRGETSFETSGLRVIRLGPTAFTSSRVLAEVLRARLAPAAPAEAPDSDPAPSVITPLEAGVAMLIDQARMSHPHSVRAVAAAIGAPRTDTWTPELVQRLADFQQTAGHGPDGVVDQATLELLVNAMKAAGDNNGAIRVIVDFFDFDADDNLISIYFDATEDANAETLPFDPANPNQPVSIQVGPAGMNKDFPGLVHTIEHEFVHVRLMKAGEGDLPTQEFLSEATEMLSPLTPEETLDDFMSDARRGLAQWNLMPLDRRQRHRDRFLAVRQRVIDRVAAGTAEQQATHQPTVDGYNAVVVPPPPGP